MNRGIYKCKNKIIVNKEFELDKMEIIERIPNTSLNSVIFYDICENKLLPKNINTFDIICNECNSKISLKPINVKYNIENVFLCKSCRVKGERNGFCGKTHSDESKKNMSVSRTGKLNNFYGKKHSNSFKQKLSEERKGNWYMGERNAMYGKSVHDIWVNKYGETVADGLWREKSRKHQIQMILNNPFMGKTHSSETKRLLSESSKEWSRKMKKNYPDEWNKYIQKISNSLKGRVFTAEHKKNLRLSAIKIIKKNKLNGNQLVPFYNQKACKYFNNLMEQTKTHIQHAENGGEFHIKELGYWVDGYDKENNIVYEYDEKHHFDIYGDLIEKDIQRQAEIEEFLGCKFVRIKDEI